MGERVFRVKNWSKFQPRGQKDGYQWMRLYRSLVKDFDFNALPETTQLHLIKLWLVCDPKDGSLDGDTTSLAWQISAKGKLDTGILEKTGFLVSSREIPGIPGDSRETPARGEERREEEIRGEPDSSAASPKAAKPDEPRCGPTFPCVRGETYRPTQRQVGIWKEAFPAADVRIEMAKALAWVEANPRLRKTKAGMDRFLNSWLSKTQDRGLPSGNGQRPDHTNTNPSKPFKNRPLTEEEKAQLRSPR